jgi:hypothetical protein
VKSFIERPNEMKDIEQGLLPKKQVQRKKVFVLHGLGGIGKTQLAVEFMRKHREKFSSVFWLDGSSRDRLKQSIAGCAGRVAQGQITEASRTYSTGKSGDVDTVVREMLSWFAKSDNTNWLIVFDNVDREYQPSNPSSDPDAYDIREFFSGADHGSILITSRLPKLGQLGESKQVQKVDSVQAQALLKSWSRESYGKSKLPQFMSGLTLNLIFQNTRIASICCKF